MQRSIFLFLFFVTLVSFANSCGDSVTTNKGKPITTDSTGKNKQGTKWSEILKDMKFYVSDPKGALFNPVPLEIAVRQLNNFDVFRTSSLENCVVGNGSELYFKKEAFQNFLSRYDANPNFNRIIVKFTEINGSSANTIPFYVENNKKLHYFFYAANLSENDELTMIDSVPYDICDGVTSDLNPYIVTTSIESGFQHAYQSGCNLPKLDDLKPEYNSVVHPNTKFIQINKLQFENFINTPNYNYVRIDFGLSTMETLPVFNHKNFLILLFFRTNASKNIITDLGVYDINDLCPPNCPAVY